MIVIIIITIMIIIIIIIMIVVIMIIIIIKIIKNRKQNPQNLKVPDADGHAAAGRHCSPDLSWFAFGGPRFQRLTGNPPNPKP